MKRWKGKIQSEKQYNRRLKQVDGGKQRKKVVEPEIECAVEGRRIIDLKAMAKYMHCRSCNEELWLKNIKHEEKHGLASIFSVLCHHCLLMNKVPTGTKHLGLNSKLLFDVNTKSALGTIHAGLGYTTVNKYMQCMNIPNMSTNSYKLYEREVGPMIEDVAKQSCQEATGLERSLTVQNKESLEKLLPKNLRSGFLVRSKEESAVPIVSSHEEHNVSQKVPESSNQTDNPVDDAMADLVRLFVAYDMGWSKRGSGRQYDSLNGYGAFIGTQTGKVLDYATRNRQCRLCDLKHAKETHDCRLNFYGSAKAMETDTAAQLAANSTILKSQNVQVGVFIGDDDSSSISAVRSVCHHPVVKHSDKNHTSRGVTNMLYKIDKNVDTNKELSSEAIKYLHRCFTYAVSQNPGDPDSLAAAIKNIPFHAFNQHDNCGDWCNYAKDPENYKHTTILGGFENNRLFNELKKLFDKFAANAEKFSTGASSQANESLNSIMSRKAPKANCYSLSESADFRYAAAVAQKNIGERYVQDVHKKYNLSPGSHLSKHVERCEKSARIRSMKANTPAFKARRRVLRKQRSQLRNRRDFIEGETYQSHVGLLTMPVVETDLGISSKLPSLSTTFTDDNNSVALVFFDLETAGLKVTCDILQIAMKCGSETFNEYIQPNESIPIAASKVNGLTNEGHDLFLYGRRIPANPPCVVANALLEFLKKLEKCCVLIAHNCAFDAPRLMRLIDRAGLVNEFIEVIDGFVDILPLFRNKFRSEDCSLVKLTARNFDLNPEAAHDAMFDTIMLQNVTFHHFTVDELLAKNKKYVAILQYDENLQSLAPLSTLVSTEIKKRMANAGISYVLMKQAYSQGNNAIISLLEKKKNRKKQVIKTKKILDTIINHLKELPE